MGKWEVGKNEYVCPIAEARFGGIMGKLIKCNLNCGIQKRRGSDGVIYSINKPKLVAFLEKRKVLDLDFQFNNKAFLGIWLGV